MSTTPEPSAPAPGFDLESIAKEIEENLTSLLGLETGATIDRKRRLRLLGVDSLIAFDLITALEARHGELADTVVRDHPTVQELAEFLYQQKTDAC